MRNKSLMACGSVLVSIGSGYFLHCSSDPAPVSPPADGGIVINTPDAGPGMDSSVDPCPGGEKKAVKTKTNAQCSTELNEPAVSIGGACVKLKSQDCLEVIGDHTNDNAILIGLTLARSGSNKLSGESRTNSAKLAIDEINAATLQTKGIKSSDVCQAGRPIVAIACDDNEAPPEHDRKRAAKHLVDDLKVPFILGGSTSGSTKDIATVVTLPGKSLLFAPSSTAADITDLAGATVDGQRLVWRAAPSDLGQVSAMVASLAQLETVVRAGDMAKKVKVALIYKGDTYGKGIATGIEGLASVNGGKIGDAANAANFYKKEYSIDAAAQVTDFATIATESVAFSADIVILVGTAEAVNKGGPFDKLEAAGKTPLYLFPDGPQKPELLTTIGTNDALRKRVRGTTPDVRSALANAFFKRYTDKFPMNSESKPSSLAYGMAGSYDAVYLAAYAIGRAPGFELKGADFALGLAKISAASPSVNAGFSDLTRGLQLAAEGKEFNYNGASGPLNFDAAKGEAPSDYSVWCVKKDPNSANFIFELGSGQTYSVEQKALVGDFKCE
jgi:branched-chain amino acid transport system substrate-binding protein